MNVEALDMFDRLPLIKSDHGSLAGSSEQENRRKGLTSILVLSLAVMNAEALPRSRDCHL
jgi:hypothetical protein